MADARGVLVVGESLVDIVEASDGSRASHAGGSAANAAVALARLGQPVLFATSYADDAHGRLIASHLAASGVELACDPIVLAQTSTAVAQLGADGGATYIFEIEWRLGSVLDVAPVRAVHTSSLAAVLSPGAADVRALLSRLRSTATISYDINVRPSVTGTGPDVVTAVEQTVALCDLVKASDEDLAALYPEWDTATASASLLALGPSAVVVTRGGDGATWFGPSWSCSRPARPVIVADTIGAGDTFGAAMLDALARAELLGASRRVALASIDAVAAEAVLDHAMAAAAVTVSRPGADPPYSYEMA